MNNAGLAAGREPKAAGPQRARDGPACHAYLAFDDGCWTARARRKTMSIDTPASPPIVHAASLPDSIQVEPLTCAIGAELRGVNLGEASRDAGLFAEIRALLLKHRCCSSATRTSRAPSTWPSPGASASWRTTRWPAATRSTRAWCGSTRRPSSRTTATRTPGTPTPPGARSPPLGCVLRCVECPPVGGDTIWANMVLAYERLPRARQEPDRRPARAPQHRGQLRRRHADRKAPGAQAQFPDAEHPVVRTHPETGEKVLFVNAFTTHFTNFHTPEQRALRPGLHARAAAAAAAT